MPSKSHFGSRPPIHVISRPFNKAFADKVWDRLGEDCSEPKFQSLTIGSLNPFLIDAK